LAHALLLWHEDYLSECGGFVSKPFILFAMTMTLFGSLSRANDPVELKKGQSAVLCQKIYDRYSAASGAQAFINQELLKDPLVIKQGLGNGYQGQEKDISISQPFSVSAPSFSPLPDNATNTLSVLCVTVTKN
jgi:hypothetical protein